MKTHDGKIRTCVLFADALNAHLTRPEKQPPPAPKTATTLHLTHEELRILDVAIRDYIDHLSGLKMLHVPPVLMEKCQGLHRRLATELGVERLVGR